MYADTEGGREEGDKYSFFRDEKAAVYHYCLFTDLIEKDFNS